MLTNAAKTINNELRTGNGQKEFSVQQGDCGIVIRKDGTVDIFQYGMDVETLETVGQSDMTDEQRQILKNGELLFALGVVAQNEVLKQGILDAAKVEGLIGYEAANAN
jgi:hypothetical protein